MEFSGTPNNGTPLWSVSHYYSHIFRGMGIVWETDHEGVPLLGIPGITLEYFSFTFMNRQIGSNTSSQFMCQRVTIAGTLPFYTRHKKEREREITKNFRYLKMEGFLNLIFSSFGGWGNFPNRSRIHTTHTSSMCRFLHFRYRTKCFGEDIGNQMEPISEPKNFFQSIFAVLSFSNQSPITNHHGFPIPNMLRFFLFYRSMKLI